MRMLTGLVLALVAGGRLPAAAGAAGVSVPPAFETAVTAERLAAWEADEARLRAAYAECGTRVTRPAEQVVIPLQAAADGRPLVTATAAKAQYFELGGEASADARRKAAKKKHLVWCQEVTVRQFDEGDGSLVLELSAPGGLFDRDSLSGWLDGAVTGHWKTAPLTGTGVYFSCEKGQGRQTMLAYLKISSAVDLSFALP